MPSPRAVLADIHDLHLDPKKAHSATDKAGRLRTASVQSGDLVAEVSHETVLETVMDSPSSEENTQVVVDEVPVVEPEAEKTEEVLAEDVAIQELEQEAAQEPEVKKNKKKVKQQKSDS